MIERRKPENQPIRDAIDLARSQEFVTIEQLALLLQASPQTVWRRIKAGKVKGVLREGRFVRINRVIAMHHWMKQQNSTSIP